MALFHSQKRRHMISRFIQQGHFVVVSAAAAAAVRLYGLPIDFI